MSLHELAKKVHYSVGYLSKIENGHKPAPAGLARQCDAVLGAAGELASLAVSAPTPDTAARAINELHGIWTVRLTSDGGGDFAPIALHEQPVQADVAALMGLEFAARGLAAAARDELVLLGFRSQFDELRRLGQAFSPSVVLPTLFVQTRTVWALAEHAEGELRQRLFMLATRYAEFAGWMAQETGDDKSARWLTNLAVSLAVAGGDPHFGRYALIREADLAMYRHDAASTVRLAQEAQADEGAPARVRAIATVREAQGHALAGDHDGCMRVLDRASRLFEFAAVETVPGPVLGSTNVDDPVATARAWCLYEVGRPLEAAAALDSVISSLPATARRARALWGARRVLAYASAGEVDHACALTDPVLTDAEIVDSATARSELRLLSRTLVRWRNRMVVRDLMPRLAAALDTR